MSGEGEEAPLNPYFHREVLATMASCIDHIEPGTEEEPWGDKQTSSLDSCLQTNFYHTKEVTEAFSHGYYGEAWPRIKAAQAAQEASSDEESEDEESENPKQEEGDELDPQQVFLTHAHAYMSARHVPLHLQDVIIQEALRKQIAQTAESE